MDTIDNYLNNNYIDEFYPTYFSNKLDKTVHETIEILDERDDLEKFYKVKCPNCKKTLGSAPRFAVLSTRKFTCKDCDITFSPDHTEIYLAYKKQG